MLRNSVEQWGAISKWLHWVVAALILLQMGLGLAAVGWSLSPTKLDLFVWHKSFGMLVLALVLLRLSWRLMNPTPSLPTQLPRWERWAAHLSHGLLYLLMILLPLSGWVINSAANIPFNLFWLIPLPPIAAPDESLKAVAKQAHFALVLTLGLAVIVHAAAALRHHLILRDQVLTRMLPFRRPRP